MKPAPAPDARSAAVQWLRCGQACEARGTAAALAEAVLAYDAAIALLRAALPAGHDAVYHELGVAWMNRGNALQKQGTAAALAEAVRAYDETIALVRALPFETSPVFLNCLGAAWLNRGHALLQLGDATSLGAATRSHEEAVALLRALPIDRLPVYRLNLAGAEINLANALLLAPDPASLDRARTSAKSALVLVTAREDTESEFADLGLKGRRALCEALGQLLAATAVDESAANHLAAEASEAVDSGLALARRWEHRGVPHFRPLAVRLYRFGAQLYFLHQPHFLAEFLLENLDPASAPAAWSADAGFQEIARTAVDRARQALGRRPMLDVDDATAARLLETSRSLAAAEKRIAALQQEFSTGSAVSRPVVSLSAQASPSRAAAS